MDSNRKYFPKKLNKKREGKPAETNRKHGKAGENGGYRKQR